MTKTTKSTYVRPSRSKAAVAARAAAQATAAGDTVEVKAPQAAKAKPKMSDFDIGQLKAILEDTQAQRDTYKAEVSKLKVELASRNLEVTGLETRYASAQALIEDTTASANRLADRARTAEAKVAELEADPFCREVSLPKLGDILMLDQDTLQQHIAVGMPLTRYVAGDDGKSPPHPVASVAKVVAWFRTRADLVIQSQKREIDKLTSAKVLLENEGLEKTQKIEALKAEVGDLKGVIGSKDLRISDLEDEVSDLDDTRVRLDAECVRLQSRGLFARLFNR